MIGRWIARILASLFALVGVLIAWWAPTAGGLNDGGRAFDSAALTLWGPAVAHVLACVGAFFVAGKTNNMLLAFVSFGVSTPPIIQVLVAKPELALFMAAIIELPLMLIWSFVYLSSLPD